VQEIVDSVRRGAGADAPPVPGGGGDPTQLLDFLMAP
jgi:hypothetical protein